MKRPAYAALMRGMNKARISREWGREQGLVSLKVRCRRGHRQREYVLKQYPHLAQYSTGRRRLTGFCCICEREWLEAQE